MAKVGQNRGFAEGWQEQKKSVSQKLFDSRTSMRSDARQASRVVEKMRNEPAVRTSRPQDDNPTVSSGSLVKPGRHVPEAIEKTRAEAQDKAAEQFKTQSNEFLSARKDAQNLKTLQSKAAGRTGKEPATKQAVVQKAGSNEAHLARQSVKRPVAELLQKASEMVERSAAQRNAREVLVRAHKPAEKGEAKGDPKDAARLADARLPKGHAEGADVGSKIAGQMGIRVADKPKKEDEPALEKKKAERKGTKARSSALARSKGADASRNLNAMLGGFAGSEGHAECDGGGGTAVSEVAEVPREGALPETDPSFHIYSEFDTANPGVEAVKSKAQLFSRHVEKRCRLEEIAKLDHELEGKINDLFENTPLSERIVGDLKDELKLAKFLGSVYGGLHG